MASNMSLEWRGLISVLFRRTLFTGSNDCLGNVLLRTGSCLVLGLLYRPTEATSKAIVPKLSNGRVARDLF